MTPSFVGTVGSQVFYFLEMRRTFKGGLRTIWQIGRVRIDGAGPDGNPDTSADNTVFAVQGVFVP